MTEVDTQGALQLANRIKADVTCGLSYEEILSRNPRAVYELAKAFTAQAAELERVRFKALEDVALALAEYQNSSVMVEGVLSAIETGKTMQQVFGECGCSGPVGTCPCVLRAVERDKPGSLYNKTKERLAALTSKEKPE